MNRRYHPPFSFAWPWPTTQEHEDIVHEGSNSAERRSKDSGENRRERDVELATGADTAARKVATHGLGLASRHRKRRRRMAPVTRTQIIERQIPTLSVEVPLPGDGESSSSSSSSISSSSSVSASSSSVSSSSSTSSSSSSSSMSETSSSSSSASSTISSSSSSSSSSSPGSSSISTSSSTSDSSSSSFTSSYTSTTPPPLTSPSSPTLEPSSSSIVLSSRSSTPSSTTRISLSSPIAATTPIVMSTTSRVISTIPLISNTSSTAPLPTPITTFVLSSSSPTSPIHSPSTSSSTPTPSVLSEDDDNSLARNTGAIIGISIASFAALLGLVFFIFLFARTRRRRNTPYPNERTSSGRMSALRNLLGASPSIGRGTTTSSFGSNTSHSGFGHGYTGSTDSNLPEARHVMSTTGGAGISLSSQLSLDRFVDHSNDRLSLSGDVDGKGSMGVGVAAAGDAMTGHATNGVPAALIRSGGSSSRISGIGVALTTDEYPAFSPILPSSATTALLAKSGLNRSTSGRSPILYRPTPPQALSPPSSYHWAAASTQSPSTSNTINNGPRASPDHSIESVTSPSPEATPYHTMASSSGHGHGLSNSSDQHSETSSNSAKGKFRGAPTFAVGLVNFGKGRSGNSSNKSSSSDVTSTFMDVKRSSIKPKGKDKDVDFGFLGRLKSGNGNKAKRGSSSSFGRPGKDPVRVGTRVSGMSFTTYALDGDRGADQVDEHGSRLRPSSLLNPPNRLSGSGPSPVDSSFPYQTVVSPPVAYSSSINMHPPSSSQHHYVPSATNRMEDGSASQTNEPSSALEPLSDAARPTSLIVSGSSTLPTVRSKRGRSQLYISNDTRWAESVADSFYCSGSSDDHDQTRTAQASVQEITLPDTFDAQQHSPYSAVSHYSQPSAAPSVVGHANTANEMTQTSTPLSVNPFARPPQAFTHSQSPSGDRTSYASNGSNVTDSSMNSYNTRPGVPEGLLRPDLRTFVLGLRTRDGGQHLSNVPEDAYVNAIGEPGGEEWRRRESDGVSVGSLRDHVDYSRPIGALMNNRMPSTTTFNSDHDS